MNDTKPRLSPEDAALVERMKAAHVLAKLRGNMWLSCSSQDRTRLYKLAGETKTAPTNRIQLANAIRCFNKIREKYEDPAPDPLHDRERVLFVGVAGNQSTAP